MGGGADTGVDVDGIAQLLARTDRQSAKTRVGETEEERKKRLAREARRRESVSTQSRINNFGGSGGVSGASGTTVLGK